MRAWGVPGSVLPSACALVFALVAGCSNADTPHQQSSQRGPEHPPRGISEAEWGEHLFADHGCIGCHSMFDAPMIGGALDGLWGSERILADGSQVIADEAYVRRSIDDPSAEVVEGYEDIMPSYRPYLTDAEIDALVAYLKSH